MSGDPTSPRRYSLTAFFFIAVVFAWLAPRFWQWCEVRQGSVAEAYENSDLYQFIYPSFHYSFGQLRGGLVPLWNPRQLCGVPNEADQRVGLFQPLNLLFFAFPTEQAMALHASLCLFLMGVLFALFGRALGLGYLPAMIGGIVYAFSGASAAAMSRPATAGALAWAPLVFWGLTAWGRSFRLGGAVLAGAALALMILTGAWAVSVAMLCLVVPYRILLALVPAGPVGPAQAVPSVYRRIGGLILMGVTALAVSAIQWLPTVAWVGELEHGAAAFWNLSLAADPPAKGREFLAQLFQATHGALPRLGYVGTATLLLIPGSFFHRSHRRETYYFAGSLAVLGAVLVGSRQAVPLEFPIHALVFPIVFCVATLAALGADRVLASRRAPHAPHALLPVLALLAAGTMVFSMAGSQGRGYVLAFACILLPYWGLQTRWVSRLCGLALAGLLLTDLAMASANTYRHPYQDAPACYERYEAAIESAKEQALGARALISARDLDFGLPANLGMIADLSVIGGDHIPLTREQAVWWRALTKDGAAVGAAKVEDAAHVSPDAAHPVLLNFMAARIVLATPDSPLYNGAWGRRGPHLRAAQDVGSVRLFVNEAVLPRAYWVPAWRLANGASEAVSMLAAGSFDPTGECVIDVRSRGLAQLIPKAPVSRSPGESAPAGASCTVEDVTPQWVVVRVEAPEAGITVLSDSFAAGWKATLDGVPCPIFRANALFRGIATPPVPTRSRSTIAPSPLKLAAPFPLARSLLP